MSKSVIKPPSEKLVDANIKVGEREGTQIDKGVILNEYYLQENLGNIGDVMSIFAAYPDIYLDIIKPQDSSFTLFFYQRITLRHCAPCVLKIFYYHFGDDFAMHLHPRNKTIHLRAQ